MLELKELAVGYGQVGKIVLDDVDLEARPGDFICILGRNGAGKSTLMRTICGLQRPLAGKVALGGEVVPDMRPAARAQRIAVVLTERSFSPGLTADDVVSLGRQPFTRWQGHLTSKDLQIAQDAMEWSGAAAFAGRYFDDLSDGERQRVMIARAIAQTAELIVLDEITAFLDLPGRVEVMALLRAHARREGAIVLLSSHDLDLSLQLADSVWLLDGSGRVLSGSADEIVASGGIERAFDSERVAFRADLRRFELHPIITR